MSGAEALRALEGRMASQQTVAGLNDHWAEYAHRTLPDYDKIVGTAYPLLRQGYDAGYADAMTEFRRQLAATQTEDLRSK